MDFKTQRDHSFPFGGGGGGGGGLRKIPGCLCQLLGKTKGRQD